MKKAVCFARLLIVLALTLAGILAPRAAHAAFGLTSDTNFYTVDTGAGLVFKVRRTDNGASTQSAGDIASLVFNGVEYQNQTRGSQVNSGFDFLYAGISAVSVSASVVGADYIKITVVGGNLTHYYMARRGYPHIYMATYFTTEPDTLGLCRYIVRIPSTLLPNGPTPSDIRGNVGAIEASDVFVLSDGQTRSKHYANERLIDWSYIGATGNNVGVWMVRDNNEGNSGGPFYRSLLNQGGSDQEITYIVNYGEAQTEPLRTGILNSYTLVFTTGAAPGLPLDNSWFSGMGLTGYVPASGRGRVTGVGINGRDPSYAYVVGFSNSAAQYWVYARASDGFFNCTGMLPGAYTMTIYKNELAVSTRSVSVTAGGATVLNTITITGDPSSRTARWRIGDWDGTPREFLNGDKVTYMHPSDVRMGTWNPGAYVVGVSSPATGFPCYQWRDINGTQTVRFTLNAAQIAAHTVRVGITCAYANARPRITVNSWTSPIPGISTQPSTRTLTVGTYRGNNTTFTFSVPASAFVAGTNTMTITPVSGSGLSGFLSAGYSVDSVDMLAPPALSISDASVTEGNSGAASASFAVTLSEAGAQTVTVGYATQPGTAAAPSDYTHVSGTLTFAPGETSKTVTVSVNGDTVYEPDETFFVNLSNAVNATIADGQGQGTIRNDDNAAPAARDSSVSTAEDTAAAITLQASDADANNLTYTIVSGPAHGALSGTGASVTYTPEKDYSGSDSFTFKANDGAVDSNVAMVSITVTPVNDAPVANGQSVTTDEDTPVGITLTASDIENDALTYGVVSGPSHGTLSGAAPNLIYTPAPDYHGADSFTFKVNDGTEDSAEATVTVTVNNTTPRLTRLSPDTAAAGGPAFTLTVTGSGFRDGSTIRWNGASRPTTYVSPTQLTAAIPASDIASVGAVNVSVVNPAPGGGVSNALVLATGTPRIGVSVTLTRSGSEAAATLTLRNTGGATADSVRLNVVSLLRGGASFSGGSLPVSFGDIAPGGSATQTVPFNVGATAGGSASLSLSGVFTGGTFGGTLRVTLP